MRLWWIYNYIQFEWYCLYKCDRDRDIAQSVMWISIIFVFFHCTTGDKVSAERAFPLHLNFKCSADFGMWQGVRCSNDVSGNFLADSISLRLAFPSLITLTFFKLNVVYDVSSRCILYYILSEKPTIFQIISLLNWRFISFIYES